MKKTILILFFIVLIISTLTYGRIRKQIIDDINVVSAIGIDQGEGNKVKGTAVIPVFKADKSVENETFQDESILARELINVLQHKSADPLVTGGISVALYQEEIARNGITEYVDSLQRDASIGSNLFLGVVDGSTEEILTSKLGNQGVGRYLERIFEHNSEQEDLPKTILQTFLFRFYTRGMDAYLPYIKLEGNKVKVTGLAIFKEEFMVDIIPEDDLFFFKALVERYAEGTYSIHLKDIDEYASIERITSRRRIDVEEVDGDPEVNIHVYIQGVLSEFSGRKTDDKIVSQITKQLEDEIVQKSEGMLQRFQKINADPVGIGYMAKSSQRNFDEKKWKDGYPQVKINVEAKVDLIQTGVIE